MILKKAWNLMLISSVIVQSTVVAGEISENLMNEVLKMPSTITFDNHEVSGNLQNIWQEFVMVNQPNIQFDSILSSLQVLYNAFIKIFLENFDNYLEFLKITRSFNYLKTEKDFFNDSIVQNAFIAFGIDITKKLLPSSSISIPISSQNSNYQSISDDFRKVVQNAGMILAKSFIDQNIFVVVEHAIHQETVESDNLQIRALRRMLVDDNFQNMFYLMGYVQNCIWLLQQSNEYSGAASSGTSYNVVKIQNLAEVLKKIKNEGKL